MRTPRQLPNLSASMRAMPILAAPAGADSPGPETQVGLSLAQVFAIARAHRKQTLIIWLAITCIAAVIIKLLPKTFTATATMIVDTSNKDPLAGQEFQINLLNNYVVTQTELIQSPVVLLPVIDRLDLTSDPEFRAGFRGKDAGLRDYVAKNLSGALQVDQGRGGQLLYVSVSARDPVKAASIANAVTDVYLNQERRRLNDPAGQRAQRYSEQISELRAKVAAAQEKVAQFRKQKGITEVTTGADADSPDTETQALNNLEQHLLDAQNQRRSLEAKLSGQQSSADEAMASQPTQQLQSQMHGLESQLAQLRGTYGPKHPKVLEIKAQITVTQRALNHEIGKLGDNNVTELSRARSLENKYARAVEAQRDKVLQLRELQGEGGKLLLELQSAETVYKRALDGYDQIMFASVGNYTNVGVISRATPPATASKPNKWKLFFLGSFAGLCAGFGATFLRELFLDRRVRCSDDIERSFGIPVLALFDSIPILANPA